jgi:hypothetical protein
VRTLTHHPHNLAALKILKRNLPILYSDPTARLVFPESPLVAFKRDRNLRDILLRSRIVNPQGAQVVTSLCGSPKYKTLPYVISSDTVNIPSSPFLIKDTFSCISRNFVYTILCLRCKKNVHW